MPALSTLLDSLVDYAGLFPPARLAMGEAVRNYAAYRRGTQAAYLGRFVVPVALLGEFETEHARLPAAEQRDWQLSAIAGTDPAADARTIRSFTERQSHARVVSVETKAGTPDEVAHVAAAFPDGVELWIEVPATNGAPAMIKAIRVSRAGAKIRTGGVTPNAFPSAPDVARFMRACRQNDVVLKATAGLHHPLRGDFPLTYEPDSPRATMFGFLNIFLAATLIHGGGAEAEAIALLGESDAGSFALSGDDIAWNGRRFTTAQLAAARKNFCRSFGSCSFTEPIDGLRQLSWL